MSAVLSRGRCVRTPRGSASVVWLVGLAGLVIVSCVPGRPARLIEPDLVGIVSGVNSPVGQPLTVRLEGRREVDIPRDATDLFSGMTEGGLLLVGEDFGRTWYAGLAADQLYSIDGCYVLDGVAYDDADTVIVLTPDWDGVGLRLPKKDGFVIPEGIVDSDGLYRMGEHPEGAFCVDSTGKVFSLHDKGEEGL